MEHSQETSNVIGYHYGRWNQCEKRSYMIIPYGMTSVRCNCSIPCSSGRVHDASKRRAWRPITNLHMERSQFQPVTTKADASVVLGCSTAGQMLQPVSTITSARKRIRNFRSVGQCYVSDQSLFDSRWFEKLGTRQIGAVLF